LKLLIVDDEKLFRWSLTRALGKSGYQIVEAASAREAKQMILSEEPEIALLDINLPDGNGIEILKWARSSFPDMMFLMITARGKVSDAVDAMRSGAYDYLEKPIDNDSLVEHVNRIKEVIELKRQLLRLSSQAPEHPARTIVAESQAMIEIVRLARTVAESAAQTVLLLGESGSGKDLLARYIHDHSERKTNPFMVINCAALPEQLLESELFGHEKGAFTDAKMLKHGILELADQGTVFMDEIGELNAGMQAKLLRVLEDWTFKRVGGVRDICVNVRLIAATNQDLEEMVRQKDFREDLYYRLNVFPIRIPPLRERPEDIEPLANHFIAFYNQKFSKRILGFSKDSLQSLKAYSWPGNVRELRNAIERVMILQNEPYITSMDFLFEKGSRSRGRNLASEIIPLIEAEKSLIERSLAATNGNVVRAAKMLRVSRDKLRYKIKKHGLLT
jgi:DNA-binding NtrC family response regulator